MIKIFIWCRGGGCMQGWGGNSEGCLKCGGRGWGSLENFS